MSFETFTGDSVPALMTLARETMGPETRIVEVRRNGGRFELVATDETQAPPTRIARAEPDFTEFGSVLAEKIMAEPAEELVQPVGRARRRPRIIALVGPTGAGKTTTLAKLSAHPLAFGRHNVGFLGFDTYRIGAVEQLETYGELASSPVEVVYTIRELDRAVNRLADRDVILVDTPGRGPRNAEDIAAIRDWLEYLTPDEVHLTLPAGRMPIVTRRTIETFRPLGITHVLATKIDECPDDLRLFDVAVEAGLPVRWLTDGQEVPSDLRPADERMRAAEARVAMHRQQRGAA